MTDKNFPIVVFGATGQQGGSVAAALLHAGWPVRAIVRDVASEKAVALQHAGAELFAATYENVAAIRSAMAGGHGVFSVQPSSPGGTITDEQEIRYGISIADLALESGIKHLVYTSGGAVREEPTGIAHFDTKSEIERHIRSLRITSTIVRPATFMELLVMPGFGLNQGQFNFFMQADQAMQVIAVEDIGKIVAAIFDDMERYQGKTFEIASDAVTGEDLSRQFSKAAGRPIVYSRFSDEVLASNPFLQKLTAMMDSGHLAGHADLDAMRALSPELRSFASWLQGPGRRAFETAISSSAVWGYGS